MMMFEVVTNYVEQVLMNLKLIEHHFDVNSRQLHLVDELMNLSMNLIFVMINVDVFL